MPVSPAYLEFILEQMNRLAQVTGRRMFGGVGLYSAGLFFAVIDDDTLYFKVDDGNRAEFLAAGSHPFQPFGPDTRAMQYYAVPAEALEDGDALRPWFDGALAVARRARGGKRPAGQARQAVSAARRKPAPKRAPARRSP